jgi:hypothetical protein
VYLIIMVRTATRLSLRARMLDLAVRALLPLLGIAVLTSGLVGVLTFAVLPFVEVFASRNWIPVQASVVSAQVSPPRIVIPLPVDLVEVRYRYAFEEREYVATQFGPHGRLESRKKSRAFVDAAMPGTTITVWVHSRDPARAMVQRELNWQLIALALPALLLCGLGFLMVLAGMMIWNDRRSLFRRLRSR